MGKGNLFGIENVQVLLFLKTSWKVVEGNQLRKLQLLYWYDIQPDHFFFFFLRKQKRESTKKRKEEGKKFVKMLTQK